jgi:hypothetical protein
MTNQFHPDDPYPYLQSVCAHEYFHAVQMAYRAYPYEDEKAWFYELTAMWAEERVFDDLNELYYTLDDYYSDIDKSIYLYGGLHIYGAWVWAEYLSQNYGNDIIKRTFERLIYNPSSIRSLKSALGDYSLDLNMEFTLFSGWNYFTGANYQPGFFEEAQDFPSTVPITTFHNSYPFDWQVQQDILENLGISYVFFENPGIEKGDLIIEVKTDVLYPEGVCVAGIYDNGEEIELQIAKLPAGETIEITVEDFNDCTGAVMAVNWSYRDFTEYGTADYQYKARIDSSMVGIHTEVEAVLPEGITVLGNYPNPFNLSTEITFYWNSNPSYYTITIYDITGRQVDALTGNTITGENRVNWTADEELSTGIYFYQLNVENKSDAGRMLLLK